MSRYEYSRFKIRIDPTSKKRQGLQAGDVVRRQYADGTRVVYSLMVVLTTGEDSITLPDGRQAASPYFTGALIEGDEPLDGELLDFVRLTNLMDERRSGALYLTASDDDSPYMDVIDGMATERTLCRPASESEYGFAGDGLFTVSYTKDCPGASRIFRLTRNNADDDTLNPQGFRQSFETIPAHPARLVFSYKIRASRNYPAVRVSFGITGGEREAEEEISLTTEWQYRLFIVTVDLPATYEREFLIDLRQTACRENDWWEIADLNVVELSSLATFSNATKARVGHITGIADPLFGFLEGYGAYFQRLYATQDVNVAGTLTAGDENGFGSTFYVGRIHKNCLVNSLEPLFRTTAEVSSLPPPTGIGHSYLLPDGTTRLECQSAAWAQAHAGEHYCFSFWAQGSEECLVSLRQGNSILGQVTIGKTWERYCVTLTVEYLPGIPMNLSLDSTTGSWHFASPQLEKGSRPTLYQPTDSVLNETEQYGAWFNRGGVGGTIQHPLLRLNADGSISSADGSFVINKDGTGYFSGGRFSWTQDTITLRDVTIRWEDLDQTAHEQMKARYVTIEGGTVFHYPDELAGSVCAPAVIVLTGTEHNFTGATHLWEYQASDGQWKSAGNGSAAYTVTPDFHGWEERNVLTIRFISTYEEKTYSATHTVFKQYDGSDSYSLYVESEHGTVFHNGQVSTTLYARVYKGGTEVTERIADRCFLWTRISRNAESDVLWNQEEHRGRTLQITDADVWHKAVFNCEVEIS